MIKEFLLPELGENITFADVLTIKVNIGDKVEIGHALIEIETDKATIEVPADFSGTIAEILIKSGDKVKVGQPIFKLELSGESENVTPSKPIGNQSNETDKIEQQHKLKTNQQTEIDSRKIQNSATEIIEFKLPNLGENINHADILKIKTQVGQTIESGQILLEIETDKATIEIPSDVMGIIKEIKIKEGEKASIGQTLFTIEKYPNESEDKSLEQKELISKSVKDAKTSQNVHAQSPINEITKYKKDEKEPVKIAPAAPTVRRFAREIGVDINKVPGTGPGGRISIQDVKTYSKLINEQRETGILGSAAKRTQPDYSKWGKSERLEMHNIRRKTAENMSYAWLEIPHVSQFDKADITELERLRKMYSKRVESEGGKLTITAIMIKIAASALKTFPQFNASIDIEKNEIVYKKYVNIGVAVDTERGLIVPVIKDSDKKNIIEISKELTLVAEKAKNKKISLDELQGGTFTITNLGGIGGTYFTPIVNWPEVAILGLSKATFEPVFIEEKFEPKLMLPLSLSYDHRIIDGADAARFLSWIVNAAQQPFLMTLEG